MKSLDKQVLYMEKTDAALIERVKEAEKEKQEILRQHEINKAYEEKLAQIKREEQRHLRAAKNVPRHYQHNYEMENRTQELLKPQSPKKTVTFDDSEPLPARFSSQVKSQ